MKRMFNTRQVAEGGISTAIFLVLFAVHRLLPSADLFINFLLSLLMSLLIIRLGRHAAFVVYIATVILAFVWPGPPDLLGFVIVGGLFPFIKLRSEQETAGRRYGRTWSLLIKLIVACLLLLIYFYTMTRLFVPLTYIDRVMALPLAQLWIIPAVLVAILLYDYLLTQGIQFYYQRIKPHLGRNQSEY